MRLYMQVAEAIRGEIAAGNPPVGGLLAGEKTLAARYGVGRNTVRDALAILRTEGLIDGRQGYRSRVLWGVSTLGPVSKWGSERTEAHASAGAAPIRPRPACLQAASESAVARPSTSTQGLGAEQPAHRG